MSEGAFSAPVTVLAFDFGEVRIGVAVGNTLLKQAQALEIIHAVDNKTRFERIEHLISAWSVGRLIVGIPYHPNGAEHEMTARCKKFTRQLEGRFGLPVITVDERYSSAVLETESKPTRRGERIDHRAAAIILDQYFSELS